MSDVAFDYEKELSKLEDLLQAGFIATEEYNTRKAELEVKAGRQASSAPTPTKQEKPTPETHTHEACEKGCTHHDHGGQDAGHDGEEDDEDEDDEEDYWECNNCKGEIVGARFHCYHCGEGEDGFDLCRSCREVGIANHNPEHKFHAVGPFELLVETSREFLLLARHPDSEKLSVRRPYPDVTELELKLGPKRIFWSTTEESAAQKLISELPERLTVVHVPEDECARERDEKHKFATELVNGQPFTALEVDYVAKTLDISSEMATRALEKAEGDLILALEEGDEEDY